jgi:hypothetical protein
MKSSTVPSYYFSAYPLKALKLPGKEMEVYNKQSEKSTLRVKNNLRVAPMTRSYKQLRKNNKENPEQKINKQDIGWFNHYE